jgi:HEAT repeat protein
VTPAEIAQQIARFGNAQERDDACGILANAGGEVVQPLIEALDQPAAQFQTRAWAAKTLGSVGAAASASVPHLVAALGSDAHDGIRKHAAIALGKLGPSSEHREEAMAALLEAAGDPNPTIRRKVAAALELFEDEQ